MESLNVLLPLMGMLVMGSSLIHYSCAKRGKARVVVNKKGKRN